MALSQHLESLKKRHADIDHRIHLESTYSSPDVGLLSQLKRKKLLLKEDIVRLSERA